MHWANKQMWTCQNSCLIVACAEKAPSSSHIARPWYIFQAFHSMKILVQYYSPWWPLPQSVLQPIWVQSRPNCFLCLLMLEITYWQTLGIADWCTEKPKWNGLTMMTILDPLLFLFFKSATQHPSPIQKISLQCTKFNHLMMVLIIRYRCLQLVIHFNPGWTELLLHAHFLCCWTVALRSHFPPAA